MTGIATHQACCYAHDLTRLGEIGAIDRLSTTLFDSRVDLNPHRLDAWIARHRESTRERTEHRDHHLIHINGPVTLPQPTAEIRTMHPTEETFKLGMFEDTEGGGA